jgi:hypothetical protein
LIIGLLNNAFLTAHVIMKLSGGMVVSANIENVCCEAVMTYFNPLPHQSLLEHLPRWIKEKL